MADVAIAEGDSGTRMLTFTVRLSPGVPLTVLTSIVPGTAKPGADFTGSTPFGLQFSNTVTERTVSIPILGDTAFEPHETLLLRLTECCAGIPMPPDAVGTILNDESAVLPGDLQIAKGQSAAVVFDIGLPAATPLTLPLMVSDPSVTDLPPTVLFNAGQSRATVDVAGAATGTSMISLQLPPAHGGKLLSARITVHEAGTAVFQPGSVTVFTGEEATVQISLQPASAQTQLLQLTSGNAGVAKVSGDAFIPAGGFATFTLTGLAPGATYVRAMLPAAYGGGAATMLVDVVDRPATPAIVSIEPFSGPASGGTPFLARGSLLTADCRLLFGGSPATIFTLTSDGMILGLTPPHTPGPVDVILECGATQFFLTNAFTYTGGASRGRSVRH